MCFFVNWIKQYNSVRHVLNIGNSFYFWYTGSNSTIVLDMDLILANSFSFWYTGSNSTIVLDMELIFQNQQGIVKKVGEGPITKQVKTQKWPVTPCSRGILMPARKCQSNFVYDEKNIYIHTIYFNMKL